MSSGSCFLAPRGLLPCEVLGLAALWPSESFLAALCTGTCAEIPRKGGEEENLIVFSLPARGRGHSCVTYSAQETGYWGGRCQSGASGDCPVIVLCLASG